MDRCDIHVSRVVAEVESLFHRDPNEDPNECGEDIDIQPESLAYLFANQQDDWLISSGDAIVFKVLGNCNLGEQGISLEEVLNQLGLTKSIEWQYTQQLRNKFTIVGAQDRIQGRGKR